MALAPQPRAAKSWIVTVRRGEERHDLRVAETESVLVAAERAGLMPGSDCRRGRCLSCAARVLGGAAHTLLVDGSTALCEEAHVEGIVLLCSAFARGPGLELQLEAEGDALEIQHDLRFRRDAEPVPSRLQRRATPHYIEPDDLVAHLQRCVRREVE